MKLTNVKAVLAAASLPLAFAALCGGIILATAGFGWALLIIFLAVLALWRLLGKD